MVGGLVDKPIIAVPTSVGYGAAFDGMAAAGMMTSCASGVSVSISTTALAQFFWPIASIDCKENTLQLTELPAPS